jgi:hypothetical protein
LLQRRQWEVLRQRGATFLLTSALAAGLETILAMPIHDRFAVRFKSSPTPAEAIEIWKPIIETVLSLVTRLGPALQGSNLKNKEVVNGAINDFVDVLGAIREPNADMFDGFSRLLSHI